MKIEREHVVDEIIGDVKTNKFKIGDDSMGIIIDSLINLYSDPIGSIVREVTSNCYDAHREKDLKLKHVIPMTAEDDPKWFHPTSKKPQIEFQEENILLGIGNAFLFRDYGVGLSQRRVEEIYTLFGNSTKRDNNHQIGGFGIGAKSPFSYTDTFYIISNHNGIKFSYMLYRGNDAFHMDLLKQSETTELNSTEVIIPIKTEESYRDIKNFVKAINNQLTYFIGLEYINIEEGTGHKIKSREIDFENDDIAICMSNANDSYSDEAKVHLMVGRVRYPLNQNMCNSQINWSSDEIPVALKFNVGELDLVPSREAIRYTDKTKDAIKDKMMKIQKEMSEVCKKELANCKDFIQWINQAHALTMNNGSRWRRTFDSVFAVQSYLAKLKDKAPECSLHGVSLSRNFFDDDIRNNQLFRGFSVYHVKRQSSANHVGGYKLSKTKPSLSDFYNLPIYFQQQVDPDSEETRKVFLKSKDFYLAGQSQFIQIRRDYSITQKHIEKETEMTFWNNQDSKRTEEEIKSDFEALTMLFANCKFHDYDDVDMSKAEEIDENAGDFETEAERRKRMGKAFLRRIYFKDHQSNCPSKIAFSNDEYYISDLETYVNNGGFIVYGNSAEDLLLKKVAAVMWQGKKYNKIREYSTSSLDVKEYPIVILKVAATLNKKMTNFINVKDLFTMKHPVLKNWYTAKLTREMTDDLYFFSCFETLNSDLYYKWKELKENHEKNYDKFRYLHRSDEQELAEMCKDTDCINHSMLANLKELMSYSKDLDLLKHLNFAQNDCDSYSKIPSKEVFLALREYLRFKGKTVVKFKKQKKKKVNNLVSV